MRYASFRSVDGTPTWGAETGEDLADLGPSGLGLAATLREAIELGLTAGDGPSIEGAPTVALADAELLPVIPEPGKVICIGVNYKTHQEETGRRDSEHPVVFSRWNDTLAPAGVDVPLPAESTMYDYEGELALVVGAVGDHVAGADAHGIVAGYAAFNDFSARDWQRHTGQWIPGKNFPASGTFGPFFVPATDIEDVTELWLETRVNGDVRQRAQVKDLIFDIPEIIEYVTTFTTLAPGDVIVTGTPGGVGLFMDPPTFLSPGDVVEVDITGLGVLSNTLR